MATQKKTVETRRTQASEVRFEATLPATPRAKAAEAAALLDLDRLPDAEGKVRLLLTPDDTRRLLERGYEVQLSKAISLAPLDPKLILSDDQARRWLEQQVKGIPKKGGQ
jgi:hypothetical protein